MEPLFTIVTICYNAFDSIDSTLKSVFEQTCHDYEYIVIDGLSTDGTVEKLSQYSSKLSKFVSEKDKGLYDAMNKGLALASGKYVLFLNAGDQFSSDTVLQKVKEGIYQNEGYIAYYGDVIYHSDWGNRYVRPFKLKRIHTGMFCSHQSIFINTESAKQIGFDLSYRYAADYGMIYEVYKNNPNFCYLPFAFSIVTVQSGTTYSHFKDSQLEACKIKIKGGENSLRCKIHFYYGYYKFVIHEFIKGFLPASVIKKILHFK